jgi:hypothetical protein
MARIEVIESALKWRFCPDMVRRFRVRLKSGLHMRLLRFVRERSAQFFRVKVVREGGHGKDRMGAAEKWPLN